MKLIVGLGNIGEKYAKTRHNLGFMVVEQIAREHECPVFKNNDKFKAELAEVDLSGQKVILAKPTTMMNLSGDSVGKLAHFYKLDPSDVWVVHDDLDLTFGKLRARQGGGSAGHNGLKSIIDAIGENFGRFRIGIANDQLKNPIQSDVFVLSQFNTDELPQVPIMVDKTTHILSDRLESNGLEDTTYNLITSS